MSNREIIEATDRTQVGVYARYPVAFVRGEGARLWDADGKRYLDFFTGLAVNNLGHAKAGHPDAIGLHAAVGFQSCHCGPHVGHDLRIRPACHQTDRLRKLPVAHGLATLAVVKIRRHRLVALGCNPLRDVADVVVQAERLLDDDDGG